MREYAILVRSYCVFVSLDDKHKIKLGGPNYPVAASERGRRVPVREDEHFVVADHDFTKFSLVPSVIFVKCSWYTGNICSIQVYFINYWFYSG